MAPLEADVLHSRQTTVDGRSEPASVEEVIPELTAKLRRMTEAGKSRLTEWKSGLQDGISEKPLQAVVVAAAVGAVVGLIIGLRSR